MGVLGRGNGPHGVLRESCAERLSGTFLEYFCSIHHFYRSEFVAENFNSLFVRLLMPFAFVLLVRVLHPPLFFSASAGPTNQVT